MSQIKHKLTNKSKYIHRMNIIKITIKMNPFLLETLKVQLTNKIVFYKKDYSNSTRNSFCKNLKNLLMSANNLI